MWPFKTKAERQAKERKRGYDYALAELYKGVTVEFLLAQADNPFDATDFDYGVKHCALDHMNIKFGVLVDEDVGRLLN